MLEKSNRFSISSSISPTTALHRQQQINRKITNNKQQTVWFYLHTSMLMYDIKVIQHQDITFMDMTTISTTKSHYMTIILCQTQVGWYEILRFIGKNNHSCRSMSPSSVWLSFVNFLHHMHCISNSLLKLTACDSWSVGLFDVRVS